MSKADCLMNSKAEFHQSPLVRVIPMTNLQEEQQPGVDPRQGGREREGGRQVARGGGRERERGGQRARGRGVGRRGLGTRG